MSLKSKGFIDLREFLGLDVVFSPHTRFLPSVCLCHLENLQTMRVFLAAPDIDSIARFDRVNQDRPFLAVLESDIPLAEKAAAEIREMKPDAAISILNIAKIGETAHFDLLMNATPVGMYPKINACPVPDSVIASADAVFDVIYNPGETQLIKKAKALGKKTSGGMAMLVWQAVKAHEIWDGDTYTDSEVDGIIREMQAEVERLFPNV